MLVNYNLMHLLQLYQFFCLEGFGIGSATRRMLEVLLSQKVAVNFSWLVRKAKKSFLPSMLQTLSTVRHFYILSDLMMLCFKLPV